MYHALLLRKAKQKVLRRVFRQHLKHLAFASFKCLLFLVFLFLLTNLIADSTGSLACGLAGCLALAATALLYSTLKALCIQRLNMFH